MYLFTLIFIFVTVIGIFTEVFALQNNRIAERQTTGASSMVTWHGATISAARFVNGGAQVFANWGTLAPCTLLATGAPAASPNAPACPHNGVPPGAAALLDSLVLTPPPFPVTITTLLPSGFVARYQTVIFTTNGVRLVTTFINPDPTGNANAILPPTGLTASQLYRQLKRMGVDASSYGYVINGQLQPAANLDPTVPGSGVYTIPPVLMSTNAPAGPIQNGAIVLFTQL